MSKKITIDISDEVYEFLKTKADETETIEMIAVSYLEEGINLEKTLRQ
jgi:predicted CopG family antitoxin